jgi:hypothetical protein
MGTATGAEGAELVVAEDGSIPADQIARLGLRPGARLRVVQARRADHSRRLAGTLPGVPDLAWEDFERASELTRRDISER